MFCKSCGANIQKGDPFCLSCTSSLNTGTTEFKAAEVKKKRSAIELAFGIICAVLIIACTAVITLSFSGLELSWVSEDKLGFDSPEKAAEEYILAIFSGDGEAAADVIHPDCVSLIDNLTVEGLIERVEDIEDFYDEEYGEGWYVRVDSVKTIKLPAEDFVKIFENIKIEVSKACIVECRATLVYPDGEEDPASLYVTAYRIDGRWHAVADYI